MQSYNGNKKIYFPVSRTQMYRQLGNAVVVPVVKEIAKVIKVLVKLKKLWQNNSKSQLDYIRDYFKANSNKNLETTKVKGIIENKYLSETGKRFEDCDKRYKKSLSKRFGL